MNHMQCMFAFYFVASACLSFAGGYVMPVCSENGGVCNEKMGNDCSAEATLKTANEEMFSFMSRIMDVARTWTLEVFGIQNIFGREADEPPQPLTYMDRVWIFFGFPPDTPKQKEIEYASCNPSVLGIILMFYFGYVFMATKFLTVKNEPESEPFLKRFIPYLSNNTIEEDDQGLYSDDESCRDLECAEMSLSPCTCTEEEEM